MSGCRCGCVTRSNLRFLVLCMFFQSECGAVLPRSIFWRGPLGQSDWKNTYKMKKFNILTMCIQYLFWSLSLSFSNRIAFLARAGCRPRWAGRNGTIFALITPENWCVTGPCLGAAFTYKVNQNHKTKVSIQYHFWSHFT